MCNSKSIMNVSLIPDQCQGVAFESFIIDINNTIYHLQETDFLERLFTIRKNVYVYMGYTSYDQWSKSLNNFHQNSNKIIRMFRNFLYKYFVRGIIFTQLDPWEVVSMDGFSAKLHYFMQNLKDSFPYLKLGINIDWTSYKYYNDPTYYDFNYLNEAADFFVLRLDQMNFCYEDYHNGINILDDVYIVVTIKNVVKAIRESAIDLRKLYFYLDYSPSVTTFIGNNVETLCRSYEEVCMNPNEICNWCVDTVNTLYEKGAFLKNHAQGLVLSFIDLDAFDNTWCSCGKSFPGFHAVLNGWNNESVDSINKCSLFDRSACI
ncbi:uncharacterized protein LOC126902882 isoform X2 [Daktulosphaira vitifoliae]|nr:uncharacterized protein LOC126902882 isoform X2 [Daktulosphaira vitifoliae]